MAGVAAKGPFGVEPSRCHKWARQGRRSNLFEEAALAQHTQADSVRLERRSPELAPRHDTARAHYFSTSNRLTCDQARNQ